MHLGTGLKFTAAAALFALATAPALAHTVTFDASTDADWFDPDNWTWTTGGPGIPGSGDNVVVPFNKLVQISNGAAVANSLNVQVSGQAGGQIQILDASLTVYGGASSTISALGGIKLDDDTAVLALPNTQSFSGTGTIELSDPDAQIQVDADGTDETVVFTSYVDIVGHGKMVGLVDGGESDSVTFENFGGVSAQGGDLIMETALALKDAAGVPWSVASTSPAAKLQFKHAQTGAAKLLGDLNLAAAATLHISASMVFDNATTSCPGGALFTRSGSLGSASTLIVDASQSLTYRCWGGGSCSNPGSGTPYVVSPGTTTCP